jgi:signal transduction histidine kinase
MIGTVQDLDQARRLERGLIAVRWFAVVFGAFQVYQADSLDPKPPEGAAPIGFGLVAVLALGNIVLTLLTRRARRAEDFRAIGLLAFIMDIAVAIGLIWDFSYDPENAVFVIGYILPLAGAIRYQLAGALAAIGVVAVSETFREWYLAASFEDYGFQIAAVSFRVGIGVIIALVAGIMARSLQREAKKARNRATLAEEAARRATAARRELAAFHAAILAGVAAEDLSTGLGKMAEAIGPDLGFESLSILLLEDGLLVPRGLFGLPESAAQERTPVGRGVAGRVAESGQPVLVTDVSSLEPSHRPNPAVGAEAAAPLIVGDQMIGVVDVRSSTPAGLSKESLDLLVRLADQIALVVHSAELRARQTETLERLRELDEMKSDFVAITSHELRTPLTAVRGFVRTIMRNFDRLTVPQVRDFLSLIDRQSERLALLVEDLLIVSRIEAGRITVAAEPVDFRPFLEDVARSFGRARDRLRIDVGQEVPEKVLLDPHRLDQVLSNLIQNAMKFSRPRTPVTVSVLSDERWLEIAVTDRGVGIPEEETARIFDRFHQAASALTRQAEGVGLGLYISKRLVEAMGGDIRVASQVGEGSTFMVRLPLLEDGTAAAPEPAPVD